MNEGLREVFGINTGIGASRPGGSSVPKALGDVMAAQHKTEKKTIPVRTFFTNVTVDGMKKKMQLLRCDCWCTKHHKYATTLAKASL